MALGISPDVLRRADRLEFSEGADWSEAGIVTNAISEALVTGRPVQLFPPSTWSARTTSGPARRRPSRTL